MSITLQDLSNGIRKDALELLRRLYGDEAAMKAAATVGMAFDATVRAAKRPDAFLAIAATDSGRASIVNCISTSAMTGLMPGGPNPVCWLIPKAGQLHWWISHRGISELARRAGWALTPVLVHKDDARRVNLGRVIEHDPAHYVENINDCAGAYVVCTRLSDGVDLPPAWLHGEAMRAASTGGDVWGGHPAEMLMKTAIKYAAARGMIPVVGPELDAALSADNAAEIETARAPLAQPARTSLGLRAPVVERPAIEDRRGMDAPPDFKAEGERVKADAVPATGDDEIPF